MIIIEGIRILFPRSTINLYNMTPERRQRIINIVKKRAKKKGTKIVDTRG